jgi:hypothetical protein
LQYDAYSAVKAAPLIGACSAVLNGGRPTSRDLKPQLRTHRIVLTNQWVHQVHSKRHLAFEGGVVEVAKRKSVDAKKEAVARQRAR